jgi:hypothetical protein
MKRSWKSPLLILSGFIPLLGLNSRPPDPMLLIYTGFVVVWAARSWIERGLARLTTKRKDIALLAAFMVSGALTETLAWANNYLKAAKEPALFHPQLFADLIIGVGFYGGWALAWGITLRRFRFQLWEVFIITGLQGIFFEQLGAVFLAMVRMWSTEPGLSILFGVYVFTVHGSAAAIALAPTLRLYESSKQTHSWAKFVLAVALMVGLAFAGCWLVGVVASVFGGVPP